jgi:hypothetical protein
MGMRNKVFEPEGIPNDKNINKFNQKAYFQNLLL